MKILIPILDIVLYGKAILLSCSLGCSNIASHLHSRWFPHKKVSATQIHCFVKSIIVFFGIFLIPLSSLFDSCVLMQIVSIFPAIILGFLSVKIEYFIYRFYFRLGNSNFIKLKRKYVYYKNQFNKTSGISSVNINQKINLKNVHEHHAFLDSEIKFYQLRDIILIAITEECIFRGFLWQFSLELQSKIEQIIIWILITVLFGASHLTLGKGQFLSKTILGAFCMGSVLVIHSVLPAIIIHVFFNIYAYKATKDSNPIEDNRYRYAI